MNNQTKWYDPIMAGAIAGSEAFQVVPNLYPGDKYQLRHDILEDEGVYNSDRMQQHVPLSDCTLLARSIDDMTEEEKKINLGLKYKVYEKDDFSPIEGREIVTRMTETPESFFYLLSIGVWTGHEDRVEFVKDGD